MVKRTENFDLCRWAFGMALASLVGVLALAGYVVHAQVGGFTIDVGRTAAAAEVRHAAP